MSRTIQLKRGLAATWTSVNPVLAQGEIGLETDTYKGKIGDGTTAWNSLEYGIGAGSIHINVADEFTEAAEKTSPVSADKFLIEDSAASGAKKYVTVANLPGGVDITAIHKATAAEISGLTQKASPTGADYILIEDAADSDNKKYVLISDLPTGSDHDAIHDNVADEINQIAAKTSPVSADVLILEDSADSWNKKKLALTNLPGGTDPNAIHDNVSGEIVAITEKISTVDDDLFLIEDSAASNAKKRVKNENIKGRYKIFSVTKNGNYDTSSAAYEDVTSWDTPALNEPGVTVNSGLGTFTLPEGTWKVSYSLSNIQTTGANRNFSEHRLVLDGTIIKGTYGITYNRNTADPGSHVCTVPVVITTTGSQVLKLQVRSDNVAYVQRVVEDSCSIYLEKIA